MALRIAFGCTARVGKDTACAYLIKKYGGGRISFAEPLYELLYHCQDFLGFPKQKDRKFLQWVGTEWGRAQDNDIWVKKALEKLDNHQNFFVSDLRFPNEVKALRKQGFVLVQLIRPDVESDAGNTSEA